MNRFLKVFIFICLAINLSNASFLDKLFGSKKTEKDEVTKKVSKRQVPIMPLDVTFMDYAAYDYYDWVCMNGRCQVCDVLTGACCNPDQNANCFLPDSCANNPCLSGGTCVNTRTIDERPDFTCICQRGLTGKYCQLVDEFTPPLIAQVGTPGAAIAPGAPGAPGSASPMAGGGPQGMSSYTGLAGMGGNGANPGMNPLGAMGGMNPMMGGMNPMMGGMNPMMGGMNPMMGGMNPMMGGMNPMMGGMNPMAAMGGMAGFGGLGRR